MSARTAELREGLKAYIKYIRAAHDGPLSDPCDDLWLDHCMRFSILTDKYGRNRVKRCYAKYADPTILFRANALTFHVGL